MSDFYEADTVNGVPVLINVNNISSVTPLVIIIGDTILTQDEHSVLPGVDVEREGSASDWRSWADLDYDMTKTIVYMNDDTKYYLDRKYNDVVRILKLKTRK